MTTAIIQKEFINSFPNKKLVFQQENKQFQDCIRCMAIQRELSSQKEDCCCFVVGLEFMEEDGLRSANEVTVQLQNLKKDSSAVLSEIQTLEQGEKHYSIVTFNLLRMLADAKMSNFKETVIATLTTVHCKSFLLMIYAS